MTAKINIIPESVFPQAKLKVKLTRLAGGEALRTTEVIGTTDKLPEVGQQLVLIGAPIEGTFDARWVNTSPVVSFEEVTTGRIIVTESGSQYLLEVLKKV